MKSFFQGFNVNSVLLLVAIVLLGIQIGSKPQAAAKPAPVREAAIKRSMEYRALRIDSKELWAGDYERQLIEKKTDKGVVMFSLIDIDWRIPEGWVYAGYLCETDDGKGAWLLLQRERKVKQK